MNSKIENVTSIPQFQTCIENEELSYTLKSLGILQINVGNLCNLTCKHCHVNAGPNSKNIMGKNVMQACLNVYENWKFETIDITGGAPEMNPNIRWFIKEASKISNHIILRTNLVILENEEYKDIMTILKDNKVEIVCSLPYYRAKETDKQRGEGVFEASIRVLKQLNDLGYGKEEDLVLNMVYNPNGAFFPPSQESMEMEYKTKLMEDYGISFNNLFTITNNPNGRFAEFLDRSGNLETYLGKLYTSFNKATLETMMCRNQLSVGWDGKLYDCDFNQAAKLQVVEQKSIFDIVNKPYEKRKISFGKHCYACTAGSGSSCGGTTA